MVKFVICAVKMVLFYDYINGAHISHNVCRSKFFSRLMYAVVSVQASDPYVTTIDCITVCHNVQIVYSGVIIPRYKFNLRCSMNVEEHMCFLPATIIFLSYFVMINNTMKCFLFILHSDVYIIYLFRNLRSIN